MDASLNIVNLIENNPITKLSSNYNSALINKVKEHFTEKEQQLFVSSFYCYLNYSQANDFVIDLDNIWQWLGFTQKIAAKKLLEKNFKVGVHYKHLLCSQTKQKNEGRGGHNKDVIMLTVKTFKLLCIKADTEKANEIHEYFVKLEEFLTQVIQEENNELKQQLENNKQNFDKKLLEEKALQREQILLRDYGSIGNLIYIIKIKTFGTGEYIVKIGESRRGIELRYREHKTKYDECLLLDCFPVSKSKDFENFIHNHEKIRFNKVTDLVGHETERELFLVGKNLSYNTILHIINSNIKHFNEFTQKDFDRLQEKCDIIQEKCDLMQKMLNRETSDNRTGLQNILTPNNDSIINQLIETQNTLITKIQQLEQSNHEILEKVNTPGIKTMTNFGQPLVTVGPRLQQINPETLILNKVYESVAECIKESNYKLKRGTIDKAVKENTVYGGYRWMYVERNENPNVINNIQPTKQVKVQTLGYIAKLNNNKTEIVNIYLDRKTAAILNGYQPSSLDTPVKNGTLTNNYYYVLYDKCPDNLRVEFEDRHGEPILYKEGVGQFDNQNNLVTEFVCKYDCIKKMQISDKTLAKALDKNVLYNNFYYKTLGSKIKML
jgi:phage anti-repressor protein